MKIFFYLLFFIRINNNNNKKRENIFPQFSSIEWNHLIQKYACLNSVLFILRYLYPIIIMNFTHDNYVCIRWFRTQCFRQQSNETKKMNIKKNTTTTTTLHTFTCHENCTYPKKHSPKILPISIIQHRLTNKKKTLFSNVSIINQRSFPVWMINNNRFVNFVFNFFFIQSNSSMLCINFPLKFCENLRKPFD